jgi:hypothetical protein
MTANAHELLMAQDVGANFSGLYFVVSSTVRKTQHGKDFMDLSLRDKSGERSVKYWGVVDGIKNGDWVFIAATVESYQGNASVVARNVEKTDPPDSMGDYLAEFDDLSAQAGLFDAIRDKLRAIETKLGNSTLGLLVDEVYSSTKFFSRFTSAPGGTGRFYGRVGGLIVTTARKASACNALADEYRLTDEQKSVVLAAALTCRVGAIDAYEFADCMPKETTGGVLVGINNMTISRLSAALRRVATECKTKSMEFDSNRVMRTLHAITAQAYPNRPVTVEAMLVSAVCRMDDEIVEAQEMIANDTNVNEEFTQFDPVTRRRYYK